MKKKATQPATQPTTTNETKTTEQTTQPRHPDADWVQKTHCGYVCAYA